ncbi:hypothetical protein [Gordonia neofelifaecis]|uniref:MarR family transcriptional regulator n=1 Tax=Gordonia neofelifaecis NRRL B-59395 TaxID=644548 RepID=F1YPP5_9ACTN|nr:hypothetical protein [Gordonia neofelifaecis]EGD53324.1 hypothetical protein SCNU_19512 [Gordonia neofelifaecis NRRL B-59395]
MRTIDQAAVRIHLLGHAVEKPVTRGQLQALLARHAYQIHPSELTIVLDDLVAQNMLDRHRRESGGESITEFRTTPAGRMSWARDCRTLSKLAREVFGAELPTMPAALCAEDPAIPDFPHRPP